MKFFCHNWVLHKICYSYICMVYILWLICGWQEQKLKNKLWLITLEFDKIWKIAIHFKKEHSIRILYIKKFLKNIHSSGRNQNPKIFHFEHSPRDFYVNLRGWNLILRAMGLIWRVLSDYNIKKNFPTTLLILGFISLEFLTAIDSNKTVFKKVL